MVTNKVKCEICGMMYDEPRAIDYFILENKSKCPKCIGINDLKSLVSEYNRKHKNGITNNDIYKKNLIPNRIPTTNEAINCSSYSLAKHTMKYEIENRSKVIEDVIHRLDYARKYLLFKVGAQFEIMDSIYEKKNIFWKESGNLLVNVHDASFQYIVIKLKELLGNSSKYSLGKIRNLIQNNITAIFKKQKIYEVYIFEETELIMKQQFPEFPIADFFEKTDIVLKGYKELIDAIYIIRDKEFAHIDDANLEEYYKKINYVSLKRIYNSLIIVFDGLLFSIAPDKFKNIKVNHNIWFGHLDTIVNHWQKNKKNNGRFK